MKLNVKFVIIKIKLGNYLLRNKAEIESPVPIQCITLPISGEIS